MALIAICDSEVCAFKRVKTGTRIIKGKKYNRIDSVYQGPQIRQVSKYEVDCPCCQSALFWMKDEDFNEARQKIG